MVGDEGKALMLRFQASGDSEACRALFAMFRKPLWRFLLRLCGNEAEADDFSQRVWLKIIEVAEQGAYRPQDSATFQTYLFTIARNMFFDSERMARVRNHETSNSVLTSLPDTQAASLESALHADHVRQSLRAAMLQLPLEQREVLALWAEGVGFEEIASIVGASRNTVIGRKRYGIEKLRVLLEASASREEIMHDDR